MLDLHISQTFLLYFVFNFLPLLFHIMGDCFECIMQQHKSNFLGMMKMTIFVSGVWKFCVINCDLPVSTLEWRSQNFSSPEVAFNLVLALCVCMHSESITLYVKMRNMLL
jgi:hypothetical protein